MPGRQTRKSNRAEFDDEDADANARRDARHELQEEMQEETTTRASGVSTVKASIPQPRSQLGNDSCQLDTRDKAIQIARHGQETITLNRRETQRIQKVFPRFGKGPEKTKIQPVTVDSAPGLLTKERTPGRKTNHGRIPETELTNLTIINPTNGVLKLQNPIKIKQRRGPRFVKQTGKEDAEACLILGPSSNRHLAAITKEGIQVKINRLQAEDIKHGAIQRAKTAFASWTKSTE